VTTEKLPPSELGARLDRILAAGERVIASVPDPQMDHAPAGGDRTVRDLAYHLFRLSLAFADAMDLGRLPAEWLQDRAPGDLRDGGAIARYGALVRGRLGGWFEGAGPSEYSRTIEVCGARQGAHELLERTTGHAAQHLRQLYAVLEELGLPPREPLPTADFAGLPLPASFS
jgi:DinB superfamily